jgi:superfamily I DNA/RNA helicase
LTLIKQNNAFNLDDEQWHVVSAFVSGHNVMVEAPPGTGKTYLGVALAASCIRHDVLSDHGNVLFLTFSKNARVQIEQQMERLFSEGKINSKAKRQIKVSNYHSFFFECLQKRKALWGVKGRIRPGSLKARESMLKNLSKTDHLKKEKKWDYALLSLAFALQRFNTTDILESYASKCPFHLKDNAFDIALKCLHSARPHYDDLIYEWRGSTLQRIDDLKKALGPFQEFNLKTIHRNKSCGKGLAQFLMALREDNLHGENANKLPQSIHAQWLELKKMKTQGAAPKVNRTIWPIINILKECRSKKKLAAVITRGNDLSINLHRMLSNKGTTARPFFPCKRITSKDSIEEVLRDRIERLKSIHTAAPLASWLGESIDILVGGKQRITVKRSQNKEKVEFASLIKKAIKTGTCSLSDLLPIGKVDKTCWMKVQPGFDCLVNKACNWNINDLGDCLQSVIDISWQLSRHYNFCLDPDALYLFKALTTAAYRLPEHVETMEAIEKLEDALLQASFLALRRISKFPVFLSAHQSKGREFDHVIIPWLANTPEDHKGNQFGRISNNTLSDDEERRLLYVAFSRAKERVTILYPEESPSPLLRQWGLIRM